MFYLTMHSAHFIYGYVASDTGSYISLPILANESADETLFI